MWKIVIILMYLCGTTLATPVVGLKKNMELFMTEDVKAEQMSEEKEELIPTSNEKSELAMTTLNLPSNATSIRADIVDGFSCKNREYGYYADVENDCQIFHVCMPVVYADGKENTFRWSFICPEETVFSQDSFTCMRAEDISFGCEESVKFYELNRNFGIIDSSMEMQSNEADSNSEMNMMSDKQMTESMSEKKNSDMQKETQMMEGEKIQKIQKRVDELKPETQKLQQSHKKKNSLRKNPVRKIPKTTTTTAIPITTVTAEQAAASSVQPTTALPLEVEITTAKIIEKLTTKHPRFTRRPDINKENKKKIEQVQKAEPVTVEPIKESTKKPFKPQSIQKRKRPHITSSLKHKFNGEEKPLKNILKTSEILKQTPTEEQKVQNVPVKIFKRPPIPEPILIKVEEQPAAEPINIVQTIQPIENKPLTFPEIIKPLPIESESPVVSFTKPETGNINQVELKPLSATPESNDVTKDSNKETNEELLKTDSSSSALEAAIKQNENELMNIATATLINDPNPTTVINMNIENIPSQESEIKTDEQKTVSEEKIEESMPPKKEEELLEDHVKNESNNEGNKEEMNLDNNNNEAEIPLNDNKNVVVADTNSGNNNQQSGIDQQSMIINLISSLVNAENSKVDDVTDQIENSEYVLPQTEQEQNLVKEPELQEQAQNMDMNNEKLFDEQKEEQQQNEQQKEQEQQKQELNNELLQMTTNNILSDDVQQQQNNEEIMNSDHVLKISSSTNNEGDHLVENLNANKNPEVNNFDAMQKFMYQQNKLYNHMTHIPVKLLTDDQYEDIHTKGALTNSDALNVIQRIEQLLQDEVKTDDQTAVVDTKINEPIVPSETEGEVKEEIKSSEVQQPSSSEEIKPIYHRFLDPIEANLLKDNAMSVDENKPIVKDTPEPSPSPLPASESVSDSVVKADVTIPEPTIIETPVEVKLESVAAKDQPSLLEILKIPLNEDSVKEEATQKSQQIKNEVPETKEKEVEQVQVPIETVVSESIALKQEPLESEPSSKPEDNKLETVPLSEVFESEKLKSEILPAESTLEIKKNLEESNTSNTETTDVLRTSSRSLKHKSNRIVDPRKRRFLFKADA